MRGIHWRCRVLERRMRRTCYYADGRPLDRLSLPLTKAVVEYFTQKAPYDDLDLAYASDVSYAGAVSPSVLIVAMIYLERMRIHNKDYFESSDPADLFTSALLCATKFLHDEAEAEFVYNDEWARSCSRTLATVNENELEFLNALQWNTMAKEGDFYAALRNLEASIAKNECHWRGFASYADLAVLAASLNSIWDDVLLPVLTTISVAALTYSAAVIGLYSCSLYVSMDSCPNVSSPVTVSTRSSPLPSPYTAPVPPSVISTITESTMDYDHLESKPEDAEKQEISSNRLLPLLKIQRPNASFCNKEPMEATSHLPPPWVNLTQPAFAIWLVER